MTTTIDDDKNGLGGYEWEDAHTLMPAVYAPGQQMSRMVGETKIVRFAFKPDERQVTRWWGSTVLTFHVPGGDEAADRLAGVLNERVEAALLSLLGEAGIG